MTDQPNEATPRSVTIEFICIDCGYHVYAYGAEPLQTLRCVACEWINNVKDPNERENIRKWLNDPTN